MLSAASRPSSRPLHSTLSRIWAILTKEFIQLSRDKLTFAMMIGVPIVQLVLFGLAINGDARHLPTAVVAMEQSAWARALIRGLENTGYFDVVQVTSDAEAERLMELGEVQFIVVIPADFSRKMLRGDQPVIAVYADATDPSAGSGALGAIASLPQKVFARDLTGVLAPRSIGTAPFEMRVHRRYNPEGRTSDNVVPGLVGVVLTMTLVMMTSMGITRERERGTYESLLATPVHPFEVMVGKIIPYLGIGVVQVAIILVAAKTLLEVPMEGGAALLAGVISVFMVSTLAVGFLFSTVARSQMQSMQMTMFFFLPNMLLSGFMFPFRSMPIWAQTIAEVLPLTHFLRAIRSVMLKGGNLEAVGHQIWPVAVFGIVVGAIALHRFKKTVD